MFKNSPILSFARIILPLIMLATPLAYAASSLTIANVPLGTSNGNPVKPNLLLMLDDSGSMAQDYTPDYVNDSICQKDMTSTGNTYACQMGDVLFTAPGFNSQYYNPKIQYNPPKDSTGTEWSAASVSTPKTDPFRSTNTINLTTGYTDMYWCKSSDDTPPSANCKQNTSFPATGYSYPDGTYSVAKKVTTGHPYYYTMSGSPTWCNSDSLTTCQLKRTSSFKYPNFNGIAAVTGQPSITSFYVSKAGTGTVTINLNGSVLLTIPTTYSGNNNSQKKADRNALATLIINSINTNGTLYASLLRADTTTTSGGGSSATCSTSTPTCARIQVQNLQDASSSSTNTVYNGYSFSVSADYATSSFSSAAAFGGGVNASAAAGGVVFNRVDIVSATSTYPYVAGRGDCVAVAGSCSYAEELQNFANWYSFYRTRMLMMKTAISRAYASITDTSPGVGFRVGLTYISSGASSSQISDAKDTTCWTANKGRRLAIGDFTATQKANFYTNLFGVQTCSYTPLRGALSLAGKVYAGTGYVISSSDADPIQYSCQQNFTFMSTDGYWNSDIEDSSYGPLQMSGSTTVGNQDGADTGYLKDALNKSDTLADVAAYYYKTDLRPTMTDDVPVSTKDQNNKQHMVTFTMGLGVSGNLTYSSTYESGGSADYTAVGQGTKNWGDPIASTQEARIDDLWHAAVNGHGLYFSASNPNEVSTALDAALNQITEVSGAGAAAATSNLEPVAGDNFAYIASYETQAWYGNLEAKAINLSTGALEAESIWTAQALLDANTSRTLYGFNAGISGTDKKMALTWDNAHTMNWDSGGTNYFNPTQLSQCSTLSNCPGATNANLFSFLIGGADTTTNGSYRNRSHILGDIVDSQPVYVKKPSFAYTDSGYGTYKATTRKGMVYVGANDGFLHAFDADNGHEDWAFMPTAVVPQLFNLADNGYAHKYFVDGNITIGDIVTGSTWKTVLVGGLNSGGNAYYALDVTDPTAPKALWEFTDSKMGKTFGNPIITKLPTGATNSSGTNIAGKWVVLLTSGYNNPTGYGVLYVLDAYTGVEQFRIYTCTTQSGPTGCLGTTASPSGLAKINTWVDNPVTDNTSWYAYGGDLDGNLWRFNLVAKSAFNVAAVGEPITVKPEVALVNNNKVVYFGTGLLLQATDKSDTARRTIFGIKDNLSATAGLTNVKTSGDLVQQTISLASGSTTTRTVATPAAVDWSLKSGWFVNLLEDGERVNVDPKIQLGTLAVASNIPDVTSATSCTAGGHAWINYLDITTGSFINNSQSNADSVFGTKVGNALIVGINIIKLSNGKTMAITTTADNKHPVSEAPVSTANLPMKRVSWRELTTD